MLRLVLTCNWMLLLVVLTVADQGDDIAVGSFDALSLAKVAGRAAALGMLGYLIISSWSDARRGQVIRHMLPWWCFGAWAVLSTIWSPLWRFSAGQSFSLVMLLMLSYCTAMLARRVADVSQILMHICVALLLLSITFLVGPFIAPESLGLGREGSGAFHPTNAAATASLALILIVSSRSLFRWQWARWLLWPSIAVHFGTLLMAQNRASLLITLPVIGGFALLQASPGWRWLLLTASSLVGTVYLTLDPGFSSVRHAGGEIAQYMARDQSAKQLAEFSGRQEMWTTVWESFLRSPWIGHGYFVSSETGSLKVWYVWANWTAHNFWLQVLVGTGVIGALLLAWALLTYAIRLISARHEGVGLRRLTAMGSAVLVWQAAWGLTNESFVGPFQAESIVFFVVLGLITGRMIRTGFHALPHEERLSFASHAGRFSTAHGAPSFN